MRQPAVFDQDRLVVCCFPPRSLSATGVSAPRMIRLVLTRTEVTWPPKPTPSVNSWPWPWAASLGQGPLCPVPPLPGYRRARARPGTRAAGHSLRDDPGPSGGRRRVPPWLNTRTRGRSSGRRPGGSSSPRPGRGQRGGTAGTPGRGDRSRGIAHHSIVAAKYPALPFGLLRAREVRRPQRSPTPVIHPDRPVRTPGSLIAPARNPDRPPAEGTTRQFVLNRRRLSHVNSSSSPHLPRTAPERAPSSAPIAARRRAGCWPACSSSPETARGGMPGTGTLNGLRRQSPACPAGSTTGDSGKKAAGETWKKWARRPTCS